jgi:hypothetical protein
MGMGMASVNQTRPHCVNQMGKTHSKPLAARHGRGTAWARQAMCESASPSSDMQFEVFYNSPKPHQTNSFRVPGNTKHPLPSLFHQISLYVFTYLSYSIVDTEPLIRQCHGLGGQSPVSDLEASLSTSGQSVWGLQCKKWRWVSYFFEYFDSTLTVSFHHCSLHIFHSSVTDAV